MAWTDNVADQGKALVDPYTASPVPPQLLHSFGNPSAPNPAAPGPSMQDQARESIQRFSKWSDRQMKGAASWMHQRSRKPQQGTDSLTVLDDTEAVSVLGQWGGLANAVTTYAAAVSGVAGAGEMLGILRAISGSEDAQNRLLRSIDAKVDALVKGPYNTGRTHLREAQRIGADDPNHLRHIEQARDCFYLAHGQAASVQSRAVVEYHLGLTWLLLGRPDDAIHWLAQSHGSAVAVVNELARQCENVKVLQSQGSTAAAAWFYPAGLVVLGMKFKKMVAAERTRDVLQDFLPFVTCAARSHNCLVDDVDRLPALELVRTSDDSYDLVAVTVH